MVFAPGLPQRRELQPSPPKFRGGTKKGVGGLSLFYVLQSVIQNSKKQPPISSRFALSSSPRVSYFRNPGIRLRLVQRPEGIRHIPRLFRIGYNLRHYRYRSDVDASLTKWRKQRLRQGANSRLANA